MVTQSKSDMVTRRIAYLPTDTIPKISNENAS